MEETFVINLAYDSESDSSEVDIAGCSFYQNIEKKYANNNKQTNRREEKCISTNINT